MDCTRSPILFCSMPGSERAPESRAHTQHRLFDGFFHKERERIPTGIWVVKLGSTSVVDENGIRLDIIDKTAKQIANLEKMFGIKTVVVTSGAVEMGRIYYRNKGRLVSDDLRTLATKGHQFINMAWHDALEKYGLSSNMVLYGDTPGQFDGTIKKLIDDGNTPVVNANDAQNSRRMKAFGVTRDNDELAATIANDIDADMLVYLTDTGGIFNKQHDLVPFIDTKSRLSDQNITIHKKHKGVHSGMRTKYDKGKDAVHNGKGHRRCVIGKADTENLLTDLARGLTVPSTELIYSLPQDFRHYTR